MFRNCLAKSRAIKASGQWHGHWIFRVGLVTGVRIERMMKTRTKKDPRFGFKDILGSIAMVYIEIDNSDAVQAEFIDCVGRCYGDIIENTKAHSFVIFGVMPRWPDRTKDWSCLAHHDQINAQNPSTSGASSRIQGSHAHHCVAVQID